MRRAPIIAFPGVILVVACAATPDRQTLAGLRGVEPDIAEVRLENSLEHAMTAYESFLAQTPESPLTPEAMRRLADLKLEKEYGILGDGEIRELPAPAPSPPRARAAAAPPASAQAAHIDDPSESAGEFERRAAGPDEIAVSEENAAPELPGGEPVPWSGPLEAIELYDQILATYPDYEHRDQILYQKARAYDELGRNDEAIEVIERLVSEHPHSSHIDEVQFRRAEYFFVRRRYFEAEHAYAAVAGMGAASEYYELALYKLGWALYKQELHEEALHRYVALLDHKVSTGYDFDRASDEADERRIADVYRVISLAFSNLGGPQAVQAYFDVNGSRPYEERIYSQLGEFYLEKLRYHDAAATYGAFIALHPLHRASPHFGMRVVEVYEAGGFPKLVLESKKEFAASYGLSAEYWRHFDVNRSPEVLAYLKSNLGDLANHYHSLYQEPELPNERTENFREALHWYRAYLDSFPQDPATPAVHYRLADLLLEHEDFGEAAQEYERTAYGYASHDQAAAAGYAAIYALRQLERRASGGERDEARREAVRGTLQFVDAFPEHEQASVVLGAAVDDLYDMKQFERAIATGRRLIDSYPGADTSIRRSAWAVVAHASFDVSAYEEAEHAYERVLEMTPAEDESRQAAIDNLGAAIYKQGERASLAEDHRLAADHFLRITHAAPTSDIRPAAEYDAGAALMRLAEWDEAAAVLDAFRRSNPEHKLHGEATKQIASIYREQGDLSRAAEEYERVAAEAEESELRREALLLAGELHEDAGVSDRALDVYLHYVERFPEPIELNVETRFKIAGLHKAGLDDARYREQLRQIVRIDAEAGGERSPRIRYLAAQSALVLSEDAFHRFEAVRLAQPFEQSLQEKQRRMDEALEGFERLVDYEVGDVTAAATFYMAQVYSDFSQALIESERPGDLEPAELEQYELVLEEEAFPFEERAIEVHEKNLELMAAGIYNAWIEKSLDQLAGLVPGRYAKFEASSGLIDSIDHYVYREPGASVADLPPADGDAAAESGEAPPQPAPDTEARTHPTEVTPAG